MKRSYQGFEYLITALLTAAGLCDGQQALADTTNTVLGSDAFASGAGSYETAIGAYALWQNARTSARPGYFGNGNTAIGYTAMYWNSTGNGNTAIGLQSLNQNRTGNWNCWLPGLTRCSAIRAATTTALPGLTRSPATPAVATTPPRGHSPCRAAPSQLGMLFPPAPPGMRAVMATPPRERTR